MMFGSVRLKLALSLVSAAVGVAAAAGGASAALFSQMPGEMFEGRYAPAAALLPGGKVLIAGGIGNGEPGVRASAEIYDPATGTFEKLSGEMTLAHAEAPAVALPDGHVLIVGGYVSPNPLKTAELFDPASKTFETLSNEMTISRDYAGAVLLPSGKVFITGGEQVGGPPYTKTAETYDPATRTFTAVKGLALEGRYGPAVALLPNGKVLIAGGYDGENNVKTAELYDPATETFQKLEGPGHEMTEARAEGAAATLQNGRVLIAGGYVGKADSATAETFDAATNTFTKLPDVLSSARDGVAAVTLPDGRALFISGYDEKLPEAQRRRKTIDAAAVATTPTTGPASAVGITTANVSGSALTEATARVFFQYGPSTAYGSSTAPVAIAYSPAAQAVGASLTGLAPGTAYHFRLVAENASATTYGADQVFTTAPPVPVFASVKQAHTKWREGNALAQASRKRVPVGTSFSFALNTAAKVTFAFTQPAAGRRVHGKCVAQNRRNRRARSCKRTLTRGTITVNGHAGTNTLKFQGRISRSKELRPGTYTVVITAVGPSGAAKPQRLTFTIVG